MTVRFDFEAPSPLSMNLINERPIMPKHVLDAKITRTSTLANIGDLDIRSTRSGPGRSRYGLRLRDRR